MNTASEKLKKIEAAIPKLLKARRIEMGFTLQVLAKKANLSAAFISQVEHGKATPSLVSLLQISTALDVDIDYFLTLPSTDTLIHRASSPQYLEVNSPISYNRLNSELRNQKMHSLMIKIPAHKSLKPQRHDAEDFLFLITGEIQIEIDNKTFTLHKGDNAHFNSQPDYTLSNPTEEPASILWVGQPNISVEALNNN